MRKPVFGVSDQVLHTNRAESLEVEGLYYLCSENKGPDQLRGNLAADLHLCFRICNKSCRMTA